MTSEEYGQYIDDFEMGIDVGPDESLTQYIERRRREFENKADGGSIGIEVLFMDKEPRTKMVSGGFLKSIGKGLGSLFGKADDAADLAKQEEIFRTGPITKEFLETVDSKVYQPFIRTRDTKGPGSYGMYDSFDDMPAGLKAAELISRIRKKDGGIDYEKAEFFLGTKLKGNESIDELIDIMLTKGSIKSDFAKGGRVGLFMGGPALEGQALQIYNSMNAYGFTDQEIADALSARGLYTPGGTTQPEQVTGIINQQIQTGGGGDGGPQGIATPKKFYDKTYTGMTFPDGSPVMGGFEETEGPGVLDSIANAFSGLAGLYQKFSPIGMIGRKIEQNRVAKQKIQDDAIAKAAAERAAQEAIRDAERRQQIGAQLQAAAEAGGGYQPTTKAQNVARTSSRVDSSGNVRAYGLKDGGLATMFTRRR